jgi:hypothetical protein
VIAAFLSGKLIGSMIPMSIAPNTKPQIPPSMILDMSLLRYGICVSRTKKDTPRSNENQAFAGLPSTVGNAVFTRAETKQAAHPVDRDIKCRQSKQHKHRGVIKLPVITMASGRSISVPYKRRTKIVATGAALVALILTCGPSPAPNP